VWVWGLGKEKGNIFWGDTPHFTVDLATNFYKPAKKERRRKHSMKHIYIDDGQYTRKFSQSLKRVFSCILPIFDKKKTTMEERNHE
jgi:hypothetical protein